MVSRSVTRFFQNNNPPPNDTTSTLWWRHRLQKNVSELEVRGVQLCAALLASLVTLLVEQQAFIEFVVSQLHDELIKISPWRFSVMWTPALCAFVAAASEINTLHFVPRHRSGVSNPFAVLPPVLYFFS